MEPHVNTSRVIGAHLVGSVPLADAEEVFRVSSEILGDRLRRLTDGETGVRSNWIVWQTTVFDAHPDLERVARPPGDYLPSEIPCWRLREGTDVDALSFGDLGYADAALASYATFANLRKAGAVPAHARFQVCLPTALAPVTMFISQSDAPAVEGAYEAAMLREADMIAGEISHADLAVQWDTAIELMLLDPPHGATLRGFADPWGAVVERVGRQAAHVPEGVELGYHLCYGDFEHEHFKQPKDTAVLVRLANEIVRTVSRPVNWIHMPVPRDATTPGYFAPLSGLSLGRGTELYLGLVHLTDGIDGSRRRARAAQDVVPTFGVATECGFGRRPAETIRELMRIHRGVSEPIVTDRAGDAR